MQIQFQEISKALLAGRFKCYLSVLGLLLSAGCLYGQQPTGGLSDKSPILSNWRLPPPPVGYRPRLVDLDADGDPDILYSLTRDSTPVAWIDDNDNMRWDDTEGDMVDDCLLIDRNKDGKYDGMGDLMVDWIDTNGDGRADMQIVADYPQQRTKEAWAKGLYMIFFADTATHLLNNIDWNTFQVKSWAHNGISDFYPGYAGNSSFLKIHVATNTMSDIRYNWENPFIFLDPDNDSLTEMAIRMVDSPKKRPYIKGEKDSFNVKPTGNIDWTSIAIDMDNDNAPGNEFDYDMTLGFRGGTLNYKDQVHKFNNRRVAQTDSMFLDPRIRQMNELIFPDPSNAYDLIFNRGKWKQAYFVYDEDDDCSRWERVEFYDPKDPFKVGAGNGGLDNNPQSDAAGDRGEWDLDNSGKGKLYIGKFDGRIHLFGAEWGCWRIDQGATFYQGWDRTWINKDPKTFATVKYVDSDNNGFIDKILYDLDGDNQFEDSISLKEIGLSDANDIIDISKFNYNDFYHLQRKVSNQLYENAMVALKVAKKYRISVAWYTKFMKVTTLQDRYNNGYWLQFYIYRDLRNYFIRESSKDNLKKLERAYYSANWQQLL